ncbi:hypothetical protein CEQ90_16905 [Lewinellaceae bacterium SD302]|nr:hypothetical protein CEQ90_16905 [Lewinellaceae bacterium SD302]
MYKALIVDDESDARGVLQKMLEFFCPEVSRTAEASNSTQALSLASKRHFDLAFVDIKLRRENGLDLARKLQVHCPNIIFVTAYDEFALEAFQTSALHYLLKPIDPEQLREAVSRATSGILIKQPPAIKLNTRNGIILLQQREIDYLKGDGNYCTFHTATGEYHLVSRNLSHYVDQLEAPDFIRIHQSYLVRMGSVAQYLVDDGYWAILKSGVKLPISRRRKDEFLGALQG